MSVYETKQKFGRRRARVTDAVVLAADAHDDPMKVCIRAGEVVAISSSTDYPYFIDKGRPERGLSQKWIFKPTRTKEEIEALPMGTWTWPLDRAIAFLDDLTT